MTSNRSTYNYDVCTVDMKSNKHPTEILKQIAIFTYFLLQIKERVYYAIKLASINMGGVREWRQTGIYAHQREHVVTINGL